MKRNGFTLIELMVSIVLVTIVLASMSVALIKLKDTLSSLMKTTSSPSVNSSDIININIDVKEIANDYDVDQMINRVKKEITKAASNRNVNTISRRR